MTKRAAIILAGGKAKRFQNNQNTWQDKALIELYRKPLLVHAVENASNAVKEIVICVNNEERKAHYHQVLINHGIENVRLVVDEKFDQIGGPIVAILTGLKNTQADYCITLPSDMPLLQTKVINYLFNVVKDFHAVVPMWPNGRLETLTMVLKRSNVLEVTETLCQLRRPHSDDIVRGALKVLFTSIIGDISTIDPELKSFVNINSPEDLIRLQPRRAQGPISESLQLNLDPIRLPELQQLREASSLNREGKFFEATNVFSSCASYLEREQQFFWAAISRENEGKTLLSWSKQQSKSENVNEQIEAEAKRALLKAADNYELEAKVHEKIHSVFLAKRARSDKLWCVTLVHNRFKPKTKTRLT